MNLRANEKKKSGAPGNYRLHPHNFIRLSR